MSFSLLHLHAHNEQGEDSLNIYHRMTNPLALLRRTHGVEGRVLSWKHPQATALALWADIVVLHSINRFELEGLVLRRRRAGKPTLFELGDDVTARRSWARQQTRSVNDLQAIYYLASQCDGLQTTNTALDSRFALLSPRRAVLPNAVDLPSTPTPKPARFTLGWAGSKSHHEDLASIAPAVIAFCAQHPDALLALKGDEEMLRPLFAAVPSSQLRIEPFGTPASYYAFLQDLHVGLAPLTATAFNQGRTDLKLVEYAAAGAAIVAQQAAPFDELAPFVRSFNPNDELAQHLEDLYQHPEQVTAQVQRMHEHLVATRGEDAASRQHAAWYQSHLPASHRGTHLPDPDLAADRAHEVLRDISRAEGGPSENDLQALLQQQPHFEACRALLMNLFVQQERFAEAAQAARLLLRSAIWHDTTLLQAQTYFAKHEPQRAPQITRHIRSPRIQAERAPRTPATMYAYFRNLLEAAPMHYFALLYMQQKAPTLAEQGNATQRLGMYTSVTKP